MTDRGNVRWLHEKESIDQTEEISEVGTISSTFVLDSADLLN
jgi:hypothetical protein